MNKEKSEDKRKKLKIPGTKPNLKDAQLLVSTGIPALDDLLGGGIPVGGIVVIDEDLQGSYAKILLKYFLAEGVINKHSSFVASLDSDPNYDIFQELPAVNQTDVETQIKQPPLEDNMKIAFRYSNLPTAEKQIKSTFGHYYDLSKNMKEEIREADVTFFGSNDSVAEESIIGSSCYDNLLFKIRDVICRDAYLLDDRFDIKNVLRIGIHQLGSPMWDSKDDYTDFKKFMYFLKCLVRKSFAAAVITVPTYLSTKLKNCFDQRIVYMSDIVVKLEAFAGTKHEKNKSLSDYHGFFHLVKLAAINSLVSAHPGSVEYTFKLKKKKLCIEKLHLPPDVQEIDPNKPKQEKVMFGCGSSDKHLLEF